jgi:hypothetical protein
LQVAHEREGSEAKSLFRENPVSEFSALDHFGVVPSHDGLVFAAVWRIRPTGRSAVVRPSGRRIQRFVWHSHVVALAA